MEGTSTLITANELKKLLFSIQAKEQHVCIRYRTMGRLWHPNFLRILKIGEEKSVLFHDETKKSFIQLPDLSAIVQFELDGRIHPYEPNFHYQVSEDIVLKD